MPTIRSRAWVPTSIEETFAFFDDPRNLTRLTPPPGRIELVRMEPSPPQEGTELEFSYGIGPWRRRWIVRLTKRAENERIVDETLSGPVRHFHHEHNFVPARRGTWVEDRIDYHVGPCGVAGRIVDTGLGLVLRALFVYRHAAQRRQLAGRRKLR